jgi:hypothetical protein
MSDDPYTNGRTSHLTARGVALTAQVAAAERLAASLVSGFELCDDADVALSDKQKAGMIKAALLEFDGIEADVSAVLAVEELLARLRPAA